MPEGFSYHPEFITPQEEAAITAQFAALPLAPYVYRGFTAKRRIYEYGWDFIPETGEMEQIEPVPPYLQPLQARVAEMLHIAPEALAHALINEYEPGVPIGWHRDSSPFDVIAGVSFQSACLFRMRKQLDNKKWERFSTTVEPRSLYVMRGAAREVWQHSIPPMAALRYSLTFRTLREV